MSALHLVSRTSSEPPPALTASLALDKARHLTPRFAERAIACEALRHCPDESIQDLFDSGLMRMMQPKMFGGSELGMSELFGRGSRNRQSVPIDCLGLHQSGLTCLDDWSTGIAGPTRCLGF